MSKSRKPRAYTQRRGNVYMLDRRPKIEEPTPDVRVQIQELEDRGIQSMQLDKEGRVHAANVEPIDLYVAAEGGKAASWLIWQHRANLHRSGYVDFKIPSVEETPIWFRVAFEYLRRNSKSFFVELIPKPGVRHYIVRWQRWQTFTTTARARQIIAPPANTIQ